MYDSFHAYVSFVCSGVLLLLLRSATNYVYPQEKKRGINKVSGLSNRFLASQIQLPYPLPGNGQGTLTRSASNGSLYVVDLFSIFIAIEPWL